MTATPVSGHIGTSVTPLDGLALISYRDATNDNLKVARCANSFCVNYLRQTLTEAEARKEAEEGTLRHRRRMTEDSTGSRAVRSRVPSSGTLALPQWRL